MRDINNSIKIHPKPKSNILVLILLLLILLVSGAVVLDSLGIVDLYLSEILKTFLS